MSERDIFIAALQKPEGPDRETFLEDVCGGDSELRQQIDALLQAHDQLGSFLEAPSSALATTVDEARRDWLGMVLGPYHLLEQTGEGCFGLVFLAEQKQPVRRKVALKVIKPGMDSRQVVARFEAERQALALMDHANIARVLDAGVIPGDAASLCAGRPYVVMELVQGLPITDYSDQHRLTIRERLTLFVSVCQAVQHAHQKGIIHRDLKPSNVLVTVQDGLAVAKVIDFGVAKALGQQLTDKTVVTAIAQMIGTPLYMSPEQVAGSLDIDTRTDLYSLGLLLYELLTGTTPFDKERLCAAGDVEMRRIIREEEPPRPSTRLRKEEGGRMKDETTRTRPTRWDWLWSFSSFILHPSSFILSRAGLDRHQGPGEGPQPTLRNGQRFRGRRELLSARRPGSGRSACRVVSRPQIHPTQSPSPPDGHGGWPGPCSGGRQPLLGSARSSETERSLGGARSRPGGARSRRPNGTGTSPGGTRSRVGSRREPHSG
jgi:serine/threonine protein kinase